MFSIQSTYIQHTQYTYCLYGNSKFEINIFNNEFRLYMHIIYMPLCVYNMYIDINLHTTLWHGLSIIKW